MKARGIALLAVAGLALLLFGAALWARLSASPGRAQVPPAPPDPPGYVPPPTPSAPPLPARVLDANAQAAARALRGALERGDADARRVLLDSLKKAGPAGVDALRDLIGRTEDVRVRAALDAALKELR